MRLFQLTQIRFGQLQFTQMFITYANLNEPRLPYPDISNSTQVWIKLFQLSKFDWGSWNLPKYFWLYPNFNGAFVCYPIGMKLFEIAQNWIKLFEVSQTGMKLFHLVQIRMELMPFAESWFSVLEFTQIFPIYGNVSNFTQWMKLFQFAQIWLRLLKLKWF